MRKLIKLTFIALMCCVSLGFATGAWGAPPEEEYAAAVSLFQEGGKEQEAIDFSQQFIDTNDSWLQDNPTRHAEILYSLGMAYFQAERYQDAIAVLDRVIAEHGTWLKCHQEESARILYYRGKSLFERRLYSCASDSFSKLIKKHKKWLEANPEISREVKGLCKETQKFHKKAKRFKKNGVCFVEGFAVVEEGRRREIGVVEDVGAFGGDDELGFLADGPGDGFGERVVETWEACSNPISCASEEASREKVSVGPYVVSVASR
ncbi:MAG: hypothetical protein ACD_21C00195G0001 [uncultured bacterium]|nr:MAG: hypothetical protein ACD_21C00195G0001 [uncultured bacterium]